MPTATFYPSTTSQPVSGEGSFINGVDAVDWVNITNRATQDFDTATDSGGLTNPNVNGPNGVDTGSILVDREITVTGGSGTFTYGDTITQAGSGATGKFIYERGGKIFLKLISGVFTTTAGQTLSGGSATRGVPTLVRNAPPAPTDDRLASQFAYGNIGAATVALSTKMGRGVSLLRTTDNAPIDTVITANATAITNIGVNFRFCDSSYGINSTGGSGAAVYTFQVQQRNNSGVIGAIAQNSSLFDYAGVNLYCYYNAAGVNIGTLPTIAQIRSAGYGINFRIQTSDILETSPYVGINGLSLTVTWTEPANKPRRQIIRLPDGRIAASRARIR